MDQSRVHEPPPYDVTEAPAVHEVSLPDVPLTVLQPKEPQASAEQVRLCECEHVTWINATKEVPPVAKHCGDAVQSGATTSVAGMVFTRLPLVPLIVSGYVPVGVDDVVVILSVDDPEPPVTGLGLKLPVAPDGRPATLRVTLPVNPSVGEIVTVKLVPYPGLVVCEVGVTDTVKYGPGGASALINAAPFGLPHPVTRS